MRSVAANGYLVCSSNSGMYGISVLDPQAKFAADSEAEFLPLPNRYLSGRGGPHTSVEWAVQSPERIQ